MGPRTGAEVAFTLIGIYGIVDGVLSFSWQVQFLLKSFNDSTITNEVLSVFLAEAAAAVLLVLTACLLFYYARQISSRLFPGVQRRQSLFQPPAQEWYILLLASCTALVVIGELPFYVSALGNTVALIVRGSHDPALSEAALWPALLQQIGLLFLQAGVAIYLIVGSRRIAGFLVEMRRSERAPR